MSYKSNMNEMQRGSASYIPFSLDLDARQHFELCHSKRLISTLTRLASWSNWIIIQFSQTLWYRHWGPIFATASDRAVLLVAQTLHLLLRHWRSLQVGLESLAFKSSYFDTLVQTHESLFAPMISRWIGRMDCLPYFAQEDAFKEFLLSEKESRKEFLLRERKPKISLVPSFRQQAVQHLSQEPFQCFPC